MRTDNGREMAPELASKYERFELTLTHAEALRCTLWHDEGMVLRTPGHWGQEIRRGRWIAVLLNREGFSVAVPLVVVSPPEVIRWPRIRLKDPKIESARAGHLNPALTHEFRLFSANSSRGMALYEEC